MAYTVVDWPNGLKFIQSDHLLGVTTDTVLLSAFPSLSRCRLACELGCGVGAVALLMAARAPKLTLDAVDILPDAAALARRNAAANGLQDRVRVLEGDLRDPALLPGDRYDLVVCNPPYFVSGAGKAAEGKGRQTARADGSCTVEEVCTAAGRLLKTGGRFAVVFRAERLVDLFCAMRAARLEPKRLRRIVNRAGDLPTLVLVEARKDAGVSLITEPDLVLRQADGSPTQEILTIYGRA